MLFKGNLVENVLTGTDKIEWIKILGQSGTSERPSGFVLQSNAAGIMTDHWFWMDSSGNLRTHTSKPTDEDVSGSVIAGSANAGASRALDNLASVAVSASLDMTDSIKCIWGASDDLTLCWDGTDGELDFAAANSVLNIGQTQPSDIELFGATGYNLYWDASADELIFYDAAVLWFGGTMGSNDGVKMYFDGTSDFHIDGSTADDIINIGSTSRLDVIFHGGTAGTDVTWDASVNTFSILDDAKLAFGDIDDVYFQFLTAGTLSLLQTVALTGEFCLGVDDHGVDVTFFSDTSGDYVKWDASATNLASTALGALIFEDSFLRVAGGNNYDLAISTNDLVLDATDAATAQFILGSSGTHGLDVTFQGADSGDHVKFVATGTWTYTDVPITLTGANSSGTLLTIAGIDATGNSDTQVITHTGTGSAIKITGADTDHTSLIELVGAAAQTTPYLWLDGNTAGWNGADNVGLLMIQNDTALIHAGASLLHVQNTGKPINSATGFVATFSDVSTNVTTDPAYAVAIESTANFGLHIVTGSTACTPLTVDGVQATTVPLVKIDASTGTGWDGADDTGALEITSDSVLVANGATLLRVESSATQKSGSEGYLARFENTGTATAGAIAVEIAAKDETEVALKVSSGTAQFSDGMTFGSVARAATADGTGTGQILQGESFIVATVTTNADDWLTLPTPVVGTIIWICSGTVALELRTSAPNTVAINGGVDTNGEMEIINTDYLTRCVCVGTTDPGWIIGHFDEDGDYTKGDVAAD